MEPTEHPWAQIDHVGLDIERGNRALMAVFDEWGVEYEYLDPDGTPAVQDWEEPPAEGAPP